MPCAVGDDTRAAAMQQRKAETDLEILNQPGHGRLRVSEQPGGAGDAARRHHRREGLQLFRIEDR